MGLCKGDRSWIFFRPLPPSSDLQRPQGSMDERACEVDEHRMFICSIHLATRLLTPLLSEVGKILWPPRQYMNYTIPALFLGWLEAEHKISLPTFQQILDWYPLL